MKWFLFLSLGLLPFSQAPMTDTQVSMDQEPVFTGTWQTFRWYDARRLNPESRGENDMPLMARTTLNGYGQVTAKGTLLLAEKEALLEFTLDGGFLKRMPVGLRVRCQAYDPERDLYIAIVWESGEDPESYPIFFSGDGHRIEWKNNQPQPPTPFKVDDQSLNINQIRFVPEIELYLLTVWHAGMNSESRPKNLILADLVVRNGVIAFEAMSDLFDDHNEAKRHFRDNFIDRHVIFSKNANAFLVAHEMLPQVQAYRFQEVWSEAAAAHQLILEAKEDDETLQLGSWQGEKKYKSELARQYDAGKPALDPIRERLRYLQHFSRQKGMFHVDCRGMELAVVGFDVPVSEYSYHEPPRANEDAGQFPTMLNLEPFRILENKDYLGLAAVGEVQIPPLPGGVLLGSYENQILALQKEYVGPGKNKKVARFSYVLKRMTLSP